MGGTDAFVKSVWKKSISQLERALLVISHSYPSPSNWLPGLHPVSSMGMENWVNVPRPLDLVSHCLGSSKPLFMLATL